MRLESKRGQHIRALTLLFVKFVAYFNITTYLFYFIRPLFQTIHIKLSILCYNSKKNFGVILQFIKIIFLYHFFKIILSIHISLSSLNQSSSIYHPHQQNPVKGLKAIPKTKLVPSIINSCKPTKFSNTQINVKYPNQN